MPPPGPMAGLRSPKLRLFCRPVVVPPALLFKDVRACGLLVWFCQFS
jgi:hypothetical protein